MTFRIFVKRYWRVPLVALLAAMLAFAVSFVEKPTYKASTRLLIVEGSTNLLNSSGQPVNNPYGTDDATSAETLSETQAGLASSRAVATIVVNKLDLAAPKPPVHGLVHKIEAAASNAYAHAKAFVTAGFYKRPAPYEAAIQSTEAAIVATDLAPSGGADTGQTDSYVLELDAAADTPALATRMANTAANALILVSKQSFAQGSQYYADSLSSQLRAADATLSAANRAVSAFEIAHHISSLDQQLIQNVQDSGSITSQLVTARAALQGDNQTVASLQSTLSGIAPTETSNQSVTTGRSTTVDATTSANPVYQTVEEQLSQAKAAVARDSATVNSLQGQTRANPSDALTQAQAGLLDLEQTVAADQDSVQSLSTSLQQAKANVSISPVDMTQLGTANTPTYPSSPKRDLYLVLGLLLGALAGSLLTYLARRRAPLGSDSEPESELFPETAPFDHRAVANEPTPELVTAGTSTNGFQNGHASANGNGVGHLHLTETRDNGVVGPLSGFNSRSPVEPNDYGYR